MLQTINLLVDTYGDPRTKNWAFVSSPLPAIGLSLAYLLFVKKIGPAFMKDRKAYNLKWVMIVYNLFQSMFSAWMFYEGSVSGWMTNYSFICQRSDYTFTTQALRMSTTSWLFYLSKFVDFIDTIIFILRKKNKQISGLHVLHHSIVPFLCWIGVLLHPEGHYTFAGYLNTFVHTIMYIYYLLAAIGPSLRPYLWWKKYLTTLQLIQFMLVIIHTGVTVLNFQCDIPKKFTLVLAFQAILFSFMFMAFFQKTYKDKHANSKMDEKIPVNNPEKMNQETICTPQKEISRTSQVDQLRNRSKLQNSTQNSYSIS